MDKGTEGSQDNSIVSPKAAFCDAGDSTIQTIILTRERLASSNVSCLFRSISIKRKLRCQR